MRPHPFAAFGFVVAVVLAALIAVAIIGMAGGGS